jgi:choline dehydrogenase-like flavoprotein
MSRIETDVVVVGSGPGGATVARELARKGRDVVLVEKGPWHNWLIGRYLSFGIVTRTFSSKQGGVMGRGITAGGSSVVFNGNAYAPPEWLATELGIDISGETAETIKELNIKPLPEGFYSNWKATLRLVQAAGELGMPLEPQLKFINPDKCDATCDDCMLGCRRGAKWTCREYIREAQDNKARVILSATVQKVLIENGRAVGIQINDASGVDEVRANRVVLAAGGVGTPRILLKSGIQAGEGFFIDPMNVVLGAGKEPGTNHQMSFSFACEKYVESEGYLVSNVGALIVFAAQMMGSDRIKALFQAFGFSRIMGMFTKIGDEASGRINADGTIDKPYSARDHEKFRKGTEACKKILIQAGARPESICVAHNIGGHPGGTAAIGKVVGRDLQALETKNLYVCDASVFPKSPGRPPTLTILALGKYLAKTL